MEFKGFVFISAVVLCSFAANVHGILKCVQCGMLPNEMTKVNPRHFGKLQHAIRMNPEKYTCPKNLPEPTECDDEDYKYCIQTSPIGGSVRFCSVVKLDGCADEFCVNSCDKDGCNNKQVENIVISIADAVNDADTTIIQQDEIEDAPAVYKKLKCVQCGMSMPEMIKFQSLTPDQLEEVKKDIAKNPDKHTCSKDIPKSTECPNDDDKFCVLAELQIVTIRFCSANKLQKCHKNGPCIVSCDFDDCNRNPTIVLRITEVRPNATNTTVPDTTNTTEAVAETTNTNETVPDTTNTTDDEQINIESKNDNDKNTDIATDIAANNIDKLLKCVQCGMKPAQMMQIVMQYPTSTPELQQDMDTHPNKYSCPVRLPEGTECDSKAKKYCTTVVLQKTSARFCSMISVELCRDELCVHSCETDNCNGEVINSSSIHNFAEQSLEVIMKLLFP